jgi:hypothetical protein
MSPSIASTTEDADGGEALLHVTRTEHKGPISSHPGKPVAGIWVGERDALAKEMNLTCGPSLSVRKLVFPSRIIIFPVN